jgi:AraC-like DNA-binding protein
MRTIRSATLVGYPEAARAVGLDPDQMLASVGIDARCMQSHETPISLDAFFKLLADSARAADCPDFGTRAAIARGMPDYGAVSLLMREAETVEQAINLYPSHLPLHADGTLIQLDNRFQNPLIVVEISALTREESFQVTQFAFVGVTMQLRWLLGEDFQPDMVSFAFPRPPAMRSIQQFFKCPLQFKQVLSGLVLNRHVLQRPPVTSTPLFRKLALQQLGSVLSHPPGSFSMKVDRLVRSKLDEGEFDAQAVADHFNIDRRTLSRRLARDGQSFSTILQSVRVEVACRALGGSDFPLSSIADEAGFESLSSFSRWFQKSFGCTASDWRMRQGARGATLPPPPSSPPPQRA